jgi:hypothetical protein
MNTKRKNDSYVAARTISTNAPLLKNPRNPENPDSKPLYRINPDYPKV